ncbi:SpoIIE family protein phosphatase [Kineosporia sp. A_224]|uniref:SpoIIE family protein phosphatase n=1 Tax=Kineosporia sp. A_224 TaxID=1962180 RepID=UPI000B4A8FF6|nr:SpoIIE family protein phosphatase [Kineosporia sp. A_224]
MSNDVRDGSTPAGEPVSPLTDAEARRVLSELAVEAGGIGTFDWDLVTGRLLWDERLVAMFGYEAGAFAETIEGFTARLHPEDAERVGAQIAAAVGEVGILDTEYRIVLPDGQVRFVGARGRALAGLDGRAARLLGAAYDTTARREGQVQLERVLESMSTAFFTVDPDWRFTYVNGEAERLLGLTRDELVDEVVWDLFPAAVGSVFETSYRRTMATGEPTSFDAYYPAPLDAWYEVRAWRNLDGVAVSFLDITARRRLQEQADQEARRGRLLGHVMEQLLGTVDPGEAAARLARLLVADLADWAVVTLTGDEGIAGSRRGLVEVASAHRDPALSALVQEYAVSRLPHLPDLTLVAGAMEGGEPQVIQHDAGAEVMRMLGPGPSRDLMARLAPDAVVVLPLIGSTGAVGILSLCLDAGHGPFPDDALVTATHVAGRAGLALDNTRLYRQQRRLAEGLQRSLLTEPAQPEHLQVAVRYVAAAESAQVGGDWYDFFRQADGSSVIAIGDVLGHDTEAAAAMGQVRSMLRGIALTGTAGSTGPADVLRGLDRAMTSLDLSTTATAVVARLSPPAGPEPSPTVLTWANAGHPPPLVVGADGTVSPLATPANDLLLGVLPDAPRTEHTRALTPGATVLLYTDGLVERRGQSIDDGLARLEDLLAVPGTHLLGLEDLCDRVMSRLVDPTPQDDVALVAVRLAARAA